jgi:HlyD family secretion protein
VGVEDERTYVEVETAPQVFEKREIVTGLSDGIHIVGSVSDAPAV